MPHKLSPSPSISPAYTGRLSTAPVPALRLPDEDMEPAASATPSVVVDRRLLTQRRDPGTAGDPREERAD